MGDSFRVEPEQVRSLAQAFEGQQEVPGRCASGLEEGRSADTGDAALSSELQQLVGQFVEALTALQTAIGHDAQGLTTTAQRYVGADEGVAGDLAQIRNALPGGAPAMASRPGTSLGILAKLSEVG